VLADNGSINNNPDYFFSPIGGRRKQETQQNRKSPRRGVV